MKYSEMSELFDTGNKEYSFSDLLDDMPEEVRFSQEAIIINYITSKCREGEQVVANVEMTDLEKNEACLFVLEHFLQERGVEVVTSRFDEFEVEVTFKLKNTKHTFRWKTEDETYELFQPKLIIDGVAYGDCKAISVPHEPIVVLQAWIKELEER